MKTPTTSDGDLTPSKKRTQARNRVNKVNAVITDAQREELLETIAKTNSIRRAAHQLGINSNTAKSIYYKFQKTGIVRKLVRTRKDYRKEYMFQRPMNMIYETNPEQMFMGINQMSHGFS